MNDMKGPKIMGAGEELELTIAEYQNALTDVMPYRGRKADLPWELVQSTLSSVNGWTREGAEEVTRLAREYAGFMLRNALAIANALDIEDGELAF
jgi:hypothetical protein